MGSSLFAKPHDFQPHADAISAAALNQLKDAILRQITGDGRTIQEKRFGDRLILSAIERASATGGGALLKTFVVDSESDDYLTCTPIVMGSETIIHPAVGTGEQILVAKPRLLQASPFDGQTISGVSYEYTGAGERTATQGDEEETQRITPSYFVGDIIVARKGATGLSVGDVPVTWQDVNEGGRQWAWVP